MQRGALRDATVPEADSRQSQSAPQSQRLRVTVGLVVALALITAAWVIGGRLGFEQIGAGGVNLSLLPKIGQPAPDFVTLTAADGQPVRLADYRGKPVWLNFWGSWCPACRAEMPELQSEAAAAFAALNNATFTILSDPRRDNTGTAYPIFNFPTHILIDEDGVVRDIALASIEEEEIVKRAEAILPDDE